MYYRSTEKIDIIASRNMDRDGQTTIIVSRLLSYIIIVKSLVTKLLLADKIIIQLDLRKQRFCKIVYILVAY